MFSPEHFIWIAICAVMIGALLFCSLHFKWSKKTCIYIMSGIALASETVKIFTHIQNNGYIEKGALPFHLCSIFIFVFFFLCFSKNEKLNDKLISFFVPIGLFGGFLAIMMATSGVNFAKPYAYQCFIYHAGIMWLALYFICTKQVKLGLKDYIRNLVILFALAIIMIWVNGMLTCQVTIDGVVEEFEPNFFYVVRAPASGLPFLNTNHGWYVYFAHLSCAGIILETLVSLPYIILEKKNSKKVI